MEYKFFKVLLFVFFLGGVSEMSGQVNYELRVGRVWEEFTDQTWSLSGEMSIKSKHAFGVRAMYKAYDYTFAERDTTLIFSPILNVYARYKFIDLELGLFYRYYLSKVDAKGRFFLELYYGRYGNIFREEGFEDFYLSDTGQAYSPVKVKGWAELSPGYRHFFFDRFLLEVSPSFGLQYHEVIRPYNLEKTHLLESFFRFHINLGYRF